MKRYERSSIVARALGPHMQEEPGKSKEEAGGAKRERGRVSGARRRQEEP